MYVYIAISHYRIGSSILLFISVNDLQLLDCSMKHLVIITCCIEHTPNCVIRLAHQCS